MTRVSWLQIGLAAGGALLNAVVAIAVVYDAPENRLELVAYAAYGALPLLALLAGRRPRRFAWLAAAALGVYAAVLLAVFVREPIFDPLLAIPGGMVLLAALVAPRRRRGARRANLAQATLVLGLAGASLITGYAMLIVSAYVEFPGFWPELDPACCE